MFRHRRFLQLDFPRLARPRFRPDFRQDAFLKRNLEGDSSRYRYAEFEVLIGQSLDLVGDFDVLEALDLLAVLDEANRHRVSKFRCELSAFHDEYLPFVVCLAAESQLTHGWSKSKLIPAFSQKIFCAPSFQKEAMLLSGRRWQLCERF